MRRSYGKLQASTVTALMIFLGLNTVFGQPMKASDKMDASTADLVRNAFLMQSASVEQQLVSLAEAIPQEKFTWRPEEGVRSVAESFLHAAVGNYLIVQMVGGKVPAGIDLRAFEKSTTDKKKIVEMVKESFRVTNEMVKNMSAADFAKPADFFGNKTTNLGLVMFCATHEHETLGQAIAYARINKIVPPWTAERQEQTKKQEGKKM